MLAFLLFLTFPLTLVYAETGCPAGFYFLNNQTCVKYFAELKTYADAWNTCHNISSGSLISIHNAIDNRAIANYPANETKPIWLGIRCVGSSDPSSCVWDDESGSAGNYSNFASGNPNVDVGSSVYMMRTGSLAGKWISMDPEYMVLSFICKAPPVTAPDNSTCPFGFGDHCYTPHFQPLNESAAWATCQQECGDLVSIHSSAENAFLRSLFTHTNSTYIRIGAYTDPFNSTDHYWMDESRWDYDNIGYENSQIGLCWSMALQDDTIPAGAWISSHCEKQLGFVCKRSKNDTCHAEPTLAPAQCNGTQFLLRNGTIYSPNYPNSFVGESHPCSYLITTPSGSRAQISFPELSLDSQSSISLYSNVEDTIPLAVLSGNVQNGSFNSTSNSLKMIFQPCLNTCDSGTFYWKALFSYVSF